MFEYSVCKSTSSLFNKLWWYTELLIGPPAICAASFAKPSVLAGYETAALVL